MNIFYTLLAWSIVASFSFYYGYRSGSMAEVRKHETKVSKVDSQYKDLDTFDKMFSYVNKTYSDEGIYIFNSRDVGSYQHKREQCIINVDMSKVNKKYIDLSTGNIRMSESDMKEMTLCSRSNITVFINGGESNMPSEVSIYSITDGHIDTITEGIYKVKWVYK